MNIVFLDIDGVLNNLGTIQAFGNPSKHLDPVSIALVDRLCKEGKADIVVSSSWRNGKTQRLKDDLSAIGAGCLAARIIDETPSLPGERGNEIAAWLAENTTDRYVILDDDSDMLPDQPFVKTTFEDGFRFRHYIEALGHLNPEHEDVTRRILAVSQEDSNDG